MFNFWGHRRKGSGVVALDLGTEILKGVLFTIEEKQNQSGEVIGKRALIKGFAQVSQSGGESLNGVITDIASVIEACQETIRNVSKKAGALPSKLLLGVGGEAVKGATTLEIHEREDPQAKINLTELHNMVHKLEWRAFAALRKEISEEMGYPEIDMKLVDAAILDLRIDGYKVTSPLGFQGKQVQMSIFNSFAPLAHYGALQNIAHNLNLELLGIVSESYALSRTLELEDPQFSAIFIDVGGCSTSIIVIKNGLLLGNKMFGIGGRTFTKRMAMELNISFEEAEKLKLAYSADKLEQKSKKIISDILENDLELWLQGVVLALSEFKTIEEWPSRILLSGGGSHLPEIKDLLNQRKWYKKFTFSQKPQAAFIRPTDLPTITDETKKIRDPQNIIPAALVNLGIELASEETLIQKSLRKVIGIMKI